jgi:hypothetical protein
MMIMRGHTKFYMATEWAWRGADAQTGTCERGGEGRAWGGFFLREIASGQMGMGGTPAVEY